MNSKRTLAAALDLGAVSLAAGLGFRRIQLAALAGRGYIAKGGAVLLVGLGGVGGSPLPGRGWGGGDLCELWKECGHG